MKNLVARSTPLRKIYGISQIWITGCIISLTLIACNSTGNSNVILTQTLVSYTATATEVNLPEPSSTYTPAPQNVLDGLTAGSYAVFWNKGKWFINGINNSISKQFIPVTSDEYYTDIALSKDGKLVSFSNSPGILSVYNLETNELNTYSNPDIQFMYGFQWISDDSAVLYQATPEPYTIPDSKTGIYIASLKDKVTYTILNWNNDRFPHGINGLMVSPDGNHIAFYAPKNSEMMTPDPEYAIYLLESSCIQQPVTCSDTINFIAEGHSPSWTSDGRLSWVCQDGNISAICLKEKNSREESTIIFSAKEIDAIASTGATITKLFWSMDGKHIALNFQSRSQTAKSELMREIYLVTFSENGHTEIQKVTDTKNDGEFWVKWSSDSQYLVISQANDLEEPFGDYGMRFAKTELFLYDIQNGEIIDVNNDEANSREVFGFFIIK